MVEHQYGLLQHAYLIITIKTLDIKPDLVFQISFKAINNLVGPNELVYTLLVFSVYFRMTKLDTASLLISQHAIAMKKIIDKVQKYTIF